MEREVWYQGKKLTAFEWVGMPDPDARSASHVVKECFKEFPFPMPPQPRLLMIARILSAHVRTSLAELVVLKGRIDPISYKRDEKMEQDIIARFISRNGMGYVDQMFRREKRKLDEARLVKERESREAAEAAAKREEERTRG